MTDGATPDAPPPPPPPPVPSLPPTPPGPPTPPVVPYPTPSSSGGAPPPGWAAGAPPAYGTPPPYGAPPAYGASPYGAAPYGAPPIAARPKRAGLAIAALVLGIASIPLFVIILPAVLAVVFGLVSARSIKRSNGLVTGLGLARAGWILGVLSFAAMATLVALIATGVIETDDVQVTQLETGQCVDLDLEGEDDEEIFTLPELPCEEPHGGEVYFVGALGESGDDYPGPAKVRADVQLLCTGQAFTDYVGIDYRDSEYGLYSLSPTEESWELGDRGYVCIATGFEGADIVGTVRGSNR